MWKRNIFQQLNLKYSSEKGKWKQAPVFPVIKENKQLTRQVGWWH